MTIGLSDIPPEILGKIFVACLPSIDAVWETGRKITRYEDEDGWRYKATMPLQSAEYHIPFTISAVCRHWNEVALATPRLWSFIVIDLAKSDPAGFQTVETWFKRSGSTPLTLIFADTKRLGYGPLPLSKYLSMIFAHVERWEHLYIVFSLNTWYENGLDLDQLHSWRESTLVPGLSAPLLRSAYVCVDTADTDPDEKGPVIAPLRCSLVDIIFSPRPARFSQVYLKPMISRSLSHPAPSTLFSPITNLIIHDMECIDTVIALLALCPNLQDLTISSKENPDSETASQDPIVSLPNLHRFSITCDEGLLIERFLSCLVAPALTYLQVDIDGVWSNRMLRHAFTTFFGRSMCPIARLGLHLHNRGSEAIGDDVFPLPLNGEYWKSLKETNIKGLSHPRIIDFHSIPPVLNKMALELPLSGSYTGSGDVCFPNLRQMLVRPQARGILSESDYSALPMIHTPRLEEFIMCYQRPPVLNALDWTSLAMEQILLKAGNLSHLCLVCYPSQNHNTNRELLASYFLDILRLPNVNANLQTLILCGRGVFLSNTVMDYLTISQCSTDTDVVVLPKLSNMMFLAAAMESDDGKLAEMVSSRFQHGSLESFHIHFDPFLRARVKPHKVRFYRRSHLEDERRLVELKREGRDVVLGQGQNWYELCGMVEKLDERLKEVSTLFGKFSLSAA